jgi:predicted lipid-binding transport protein (Tim44 family)
MPTSTIFLVSLLGGVLGILLDGALGGILGGMGAFLILRLQQLSIRIAALEKKSPTTPASEPATSSEAHPPHG